MCKFFVKLYSWLNTDYKNIILNCNVIIIYKFKTKKIYLKFYLQMIIFFSNYKNFYFIIIHQIYYQRISNKMF